MIQTVVHYSMHYLVIVFIAILYNRHNWFRCWLILAATTIIDVDHLFACITFSPFEFNANLLFVPYRCSVGFHPLHSFFAIGIYILGLIFIKNKSGKLVFIGLLFHIFTDFIDCLFSFSKCSSCYEKSKIFELAEFFKLLIKF